MEEKEVSFSIVSSDDGFIGITPNDCNDNLNYRETLELINKLIQMTMAKSYENIDKNNEDELCEYYDNADEFRTNLVESVINTELIFEQAMSGYIPTQKLIICNVLDCDPIKAKKPSDLSKVILCNDNTMLPLCSIISDNITTQQALASILSTFSDIISSVCEDDTKEEALNYMNFLVNRIRSCAEQYINDIYEE